jgi:integrase
MTGTVRAGGVDQGRALPGGSPTGTASRRLAAVPASFGPVVAPPGELPGLRWEDVDFDRGVIRVRKCLKALPDPKTGKRRLVLEDLKTEQSQRTMQMPRLAAGALRELRKDQARWKLKVGAAYDVRDMGLVFMALMTRAPTGEGGGLESRGRERRSGCEALTSLT